MINVTTLQISISKYKTQNLYDKVIIQQAYSLIQRPNMGFSRNLQDKAHGLVISLKLVEQNFTKDESIAILEQEHTLCTAIDN